MVTAESTIFSCLGISEIDICPPMANYTRLSQKQKPGRGKPVSCYNVVNVIEGRIE
jgi:hypothetical protein